MPSSTSRKAERIVLLRWTPWTVRPNSRWSTAGSFTCGRRRARVATKDLIAHQSVTKYILSAIPWECSSSGNGICRRAPILGDSESTPRRLLYFSGLQTVLVEPKSSKA